MKINDEIAAMRADGLSEEQIIKFARRNGVDMQPGGCVIRTFPRTRRVSVEVDGRTALMMDADDVGHVFRHDGASMARALILAALEACGGAPEASPAPCPTTAEIVGADAMHDEEAAAQIIGVDAIRADLALREA